MWRHPSDGHSLNEILDESLVGTLAEYKSYAWVLKRLLDRIVKHFQIGTQLTKIRWLEVPTL